MKTEDKYGIVWWIALVIGMLGVIGHFVTLPLITGYSFALVVAAFVLFLLRPLLDDLMHA